VELTANMLLILAGTPPASAPIVGVVPEIVITLVALVALDLVYPTTKLDPRAINPPWLGLESCAAPILLDSVVVTAVFTVMLMALMLSTTAWKAVVESHVQTRTWLAAVRTACAKYRVEPAERISVGEPIVPSDESYIMPYRDVPLWSRINERLASMVTKS
jgi:hypothetical protein